MKMPTVLSIIEDESRVSNEKHYSFSTAYIDALEDAVHYSPDTLLTVNEYINQDGFYRGNSGAEIQLATREKVYPMAVCFKFKNEVPSHFIIKQIIDDENTKDKRVGVTVAINKLSCNRLLTEWVNIAPFISVGNQYKLVAPNGNNLVSAVVKYGMICGEIINEETRDIINKYKLTDKELRDFLAQNTESLMNAAKHDYIDMFKYLAPRVIPECDYTPMYAESALQSAVANNAIQVCRHLLITYKYFNNMDQCLKLAANNENIDLLSLLFLSKVKADKQPKAGFNLDIRDGLAP